MKVYCKKINTELPKEKQSRGGCIVPTYTTITSGKNDGAFQMSRGIIEFLANSFCHKAKTAIRMYEIIERAISYGVFHPTAGAWL